MYVIVISDNIDIVNLPLPTDPTFQGALPSFAGWGISGMYIAGQERVSVLQEK
jgi:hypothetical protein